MSYLFLEAYGLLFPAEGGEYHSLVESRGLETFGSCLPSSTMPAGLLEGYISKPPALQHDPRNQPVICSLPQLLHRPFHSANVPPASRRKQRSDAPRATRGLWPTSVGFLSKLSRQLKMVYYDLSKDLCHNNHRWHIVFN